MHKLKILDLFSGIGGFSLGLERTGHYETVAFCEIDKYCKLILKKHWKGIKIYDDVKEITKERLEADGIQVPEIITGGFPCQSFSVAGKQKGTDDSRYLWPEMFRIIKIFKSKFVIGENVRGIVNIQDGMVFETVCSDLESEGYEVQPFLIPAAGVGAPHRRDRIWFIAHLANAITGNVEAGRQRHGTLRTGHQEERLSDHVASGGETVADTESISSNVGGRREHQEERDGQRKIRGEGSEDVADPESHRRNSKTQSEMDKEENRRKKRRRFDDSSESDGESAWWDIEPDVGRVAHGVSGRIHRLKGLGNAICPRIAEEIGNAIIKATLSKIRQK